jgi:hypothetical protein
MTTHSTLRCYDYVNQPYERVQEALRANPVDIFRRATASTAVRATEVGAQLRVQVGALDVATEIEIVVGPVEDRTSSPWGYPITEFPLSWHSKQHPSLFPQMRAKLLVYPLSKSETQLELDGTYDPPFGLLGDALDALVGHRIAEACVLRFIQDVAAGLRSDMKVTQAEPGSGPRRA